MQCYVNISTSRFSYLLVVMIGSILPPPPPHSSLSPWSSTPPLPFPLSSPTEPSPHPLCSSSDKYKQEGNEAYKSGDYQQARDLYSSAILLDPQNATLYGNRSASYMMLQDFSAALEDSTRSVHLDDSYTKVSDASRVVRTLENYGIKYILEAA